MSLLDSITLTTGHLLTVEEQGVVVATLEYDWVKDAADMMRVDGGERPVGGNVLYVSNINVLPIHPHAIWQLKQLLPPHRWIVGLTEDWKLKAPKGVPDGFYG